MRARGQSTRAERARVWAWLAHMAHVEGDGLIYAYPRPDGWEMGVERAQESAEACLAKAESVLGEPMTDDFWADAMDRFAGGAA